MDLNAFARTSHWVYSVKKHGETIAWFENKGNAEEFAKSKNKRTKTKPYVVVEWYYTSNRSSFCITEELKEEVKWFASAFKKFEEELKKMGFNEDTISKIVPFFASRWCTSTLGDWLHNQLCEQDNGSIYDHLRMMDDDIEGRMNHLQECVDGLMKVVIKKRDSAN